jgi:ribosomal protein S18 acetylase RimI-like enzyme
MHSVQRALRESPLPYSLREYRPDDFDEIWRLDRECFPPEVSYSRLELTVYLNRRGAFALVGEELQRGQLLGFIIAECRKREGHIITLDVSAYARRQGLGTALMSSAEQRLRQSECSRVRLETAIDNHSAITFYRRLGYSIARVLPRYYSTGADALVMIKELA